MKRNFTLTKSVKRYILAMFAFVGMLCGADSAFAQVIAQVGSGTSTTGTTSASPVNIYYRSLHFQVVYLKADIDAAILTAGGTINTPKVIDSLAWDVVGVPGYALPNYTIRMKNTTATTAATHDGVGLQLVSTTASYAPVAGSFNDFLVFQNSFGWDGNSNILIDVCFDQVPSWSSTGTVKYSTVNTSFRYVRSDGSSQCPTATSSTGSTRPNIKLSIKDAPPCSAATFPSNVHASAFPKTLCVSGNVNLSIDSTMPNATGITYQWQSSPNGAAPWTNVGTASSAPGTTINGLSSTTYYRMQVLCNGTAVVTTSMDTVIVNSPGSVTGTAGQRCGPGQVALGATPTVPGTQINWYTTPTGGLPVGSGTSYVTPYVPSTTNFYAAATSGTNPVTQWVGTGTTTLSAPNPYYNYYWGNKNQYLIRASELLAAGFGPGAIQSIAFQVVGSNSLALTNFEIKMKQTALTTLTTWESGLTTVYTNASYLPTASSVNTHTLSTPFVWDGVSNLVIETCFNNSSWVSGSTVTGGSVGFNASLYYYSDNATVCTAPAYVNTSTNRPNIQFGMLVSCESPRVPVTATINSGPAATKSAPPVVCNGAVATLSMTPPTPNPYTPYVWYPTTDLYTDAAATIPYTGGTANTVYMKSTTPGLHTYYTIGGDTLVTSSTCSRADTFKVWVQPGGQNITAFPDTICNSGTTVLTVNPNSNYYAGSLQWQESATIGGAYTDIAGANSVTYTTPTLTTDHSYRIKVSANGTICANPVKNILVANPQLISKTDSSHCGPGQVTLQAVTGGNSTPRWYEESTGGLPLGYGSVWQTPYLTQTDTFFVTAGGGVTPAFAQIGNGTSTSTGAVTPFYGSWGGYKHQYLIKESELTAAGLTGGAIITSMALDVVTSGASYNGFAVSMGHTTATALATSSWVPVTQVKSPSNWTTNSGLNTFTFDAPFVWDGTSNIVVQTCWSNNNSFNTTNTVKYHTTSFVATHYNYADYYTPADMCSYTSSGSTISQRPNIRLEAQLPCESPRQMVIATINPVPAPDMGADIDTCIDQGSAITLDPGTLPDNPVFAWDNASTGATRDVTLTGTYNVEVTNQYGCIGYDTINVNMKWNPVVDLAAGGSGLCLGSTKVLDAGTGGQNGGDYYWNTGATTQTISVTAPGTFIVYVTSNQGCLTIDTVDVIAAGYMPTVDGIVTQPLSANSFKFSVLNPQNVASYEWNFGDGSNPVTVPVTTSAVGLTNHTFPGGGNYNVTLKTYSVCGDVLDSTMVTIIGLGINDMDKDGQLVQIYPNPNNGNLFYVEAMGNVQIKELVIFNAIGQEVMKVKAFEAGTQKHKVSLPEHMAAGVYNVRISTDKGMTTRKLEITK